MTGNASLSSIKGKIILYCVYSVFRKRIYVTIENRAKCLQKLLDILMTVQPTLIENAVVKFLFKKKLLFGRLSLFL